MAGAERPPYLNNNGWQQAALQQQYQGQLQGMGQALGMFGQLGAVGLPLPPQFQAWLQAGQQTTQAESEAVKTAEALLLRNLNDEQRASWEKHRGFWVTAKSGNRYWLDGQRPRGLPIDGPPQSYCIYSLDENGLHLPIGDQILAQKLLIEADEDRFLKVANANRL